MEAKEKTISELKKQEGVAYIKPFTDPSIFNMGLERHGLSLMDGGYIEEDLTYIEDGGITRYITGLDENSPDVLKLPEEERKERVRKIRETVSKLEYMLSYNKVDPKDEHFWDKVKTLHPSNEAYWSNIRIRVGSHGKVLSLDNPTDLVLYHCIKAGGFKLIAGSLEEAYSRPYVKFYLENPVERAEIISENKKLKNQAVASVALLDSNGEYEKMLYIFKIISKRGHVYRGSLMDYEIYDKLDHIIHGTGEFGKPSRSTLIKISELAGANMKELAIRAFFTDLEMLGKIIFKKREGQYYSTDLNNFLGSNEDEAVRYLGSVSGKEDLRTLLSIYADELGFNIMTFELTESKKKPSSNSKSGNKKSGGDSEVTL